MNTPSITPAQIKAVILAVLAVLAAFGLPISADKRHALLGLAEVVPTALIIADAVIRHGRAKAAGEVMQAKILDAQAKAAAKAAEAAGSISPAPPNAE